MDLSQTLAAINAVLWNETWIFIIAGTGVLFTLWSGFSQYRALTHGTMVLRGVYDDPNDPGAINHFQALSAALSGTVGLGNIGGVALAISLGGPGAIFWMWIVGFMGMAIKLTEVTLSMLYRNVDDPDNPHGGPMWVADKALRRINPKFAWLGVALGSTYAFCVMTSSITGGNMFQAWNVADLSGSYFGIDGWITGVVLTAAVALVLIGGIRRIGKVTATLVPAMVLVYVVAGMWVLFANVGEIPRMLALIVTSAFAPTEATGAFVGGTVASAFLFGMKRAVFSNEAGQGSSAIAHAAVKTDEPVREGLVGGIEPFIDTIVVCTFTALIILSTGIWNRAPDLALSPVPVAQQTANGWQFADMDLPGEEWLEGQTLLLVVEAGENASTGQTRHRIAGTAVLKQPASDAATDGSGASAAGASANKMGSGADDAAPNVTRETALGSAGHVAAGTIANSALDARAETASDSSGSAGARTTANGALGNSQRARLVATWQPFVSDVPPTIVGGGLYADHVGATLTAQAFDTVVPGLGKWLISIGSWLFAISTIIAWGYYGEQGAVYLFGARATLPFRVVYCSATFVATLGHIKTSADLDNLTGIGLGIIIYANLPICWIFGYQAMRAYREYIGRLKDGRMGPDHPPPRLDDLLSGRDVQR